MTYDDRELRSRVRRLIDAQPVPATSLGYRPVGSGRWVFAAACLVVASIVVLFARSAQLWTPSAVSTATPASSPAAEHLELPPGTDGRVSLVSPDARFVAGVAGDRSRVGLYRIDRRDSQPDAPTLQVVAELRGRIGNVAWVEDSSAVLVQVEASAGSSGQSSVEVTMLRTDGQVRMLPVSVRSFTNRRASLSPDGRWIWVPSDCCSSSIRLFALDTFTVATPIAAPTDGSSVDFLGWDQDGLLLYQRRWPDHSVLYAADVSGAERYSVAAPFGGASWTVAAAAADRSWYLIAFAHGPGSPEGLRLLLDRQFRALPAEVEAGAAYGFGASGDTFVYYRADGAMSAYDVRTGTSHRLALMLGASGPTRSLATIGIAGRTFVWVDGTRASVGDLDSGAVAELPLQYPPNVDRLDETNLAEYRADSIAIIDLTAWLQRYH